MADFLGHQNLKLTPSKQQIHSYFQLFFRDYCWDSEEVQVYFNFVKSNITTKTKNVLILGAGPGKLSFDLAKEFPDTNFISFDHNPFLFFKANQIFHGEEVELHDYSQYPKDLESTSKSYKIKEDPLIQKNHQFILGNFPDLPFNNDVFDLIIGPWFFDILENDFKRSVQHGLNFLKEDGQFLLYGPSNTHKDSYEDQLTSEEIIDSLGCLFKTHKAFTKDLIYLHSPLNSQNRIENVLFFKGTILESKDTLLSKDDDTLPQNLSFTPGLERFKAENETFYHILKHVTEDITENELALVIQKEFNFTTDESLFYAKTVIFKIKSEVS